MFSKSTTAATITISNGDGGYLTHPLLFGVIVVCCFALYDFITNKMKKKMKNGTGKNKTSPLIVNGHEVQHTAPPWPVVPGGLFFPLIGNHVPGGFENIAVTFEKWAHLYGNEHGVYICYMGSTKLVVLCSNKTLAQVEKYRPYIVRRRRNVSRALESVNAGGIFTAEGTIWKKERRLVGPALNRKNVRDYVSIAKLIASRLVQKWEQQIRVATAEQQQEQIGTTVGLADHDQEEDTTKDKEIITVINDDMLAYSMDIISLVALAKDIDTLRVNNKTKKTGVEDQINGDVGIGEDIKLIFKKSMQRIFAPFPYWKIPIIGQYLDGAGFSVNRAKKKITQIINEHKQLQREGQQQEQELQEEHTTVSSSSATTATATATSTSATTTMMDTEEQQHQISSEDRTKSFLGKILTLSNTEKVFMSLERMIGNLLTMFSAGSETTYNVLIVCLYEIAIDTGSLQEELYQEIRTLFGTSNSDNNEEHVDKTEYDDLQTGLPRLRSLMYEILRLKGPTPILGAESVTDEVYIDGYQQPTDTQFILLSRYASTIEEEGTETENENHIPIEDSKRSVPKGPMNSPVNIFCPRRWLIVNNDNDNDNDNETKEEEETSTYTNKTRSNSSSSSTTLSSNKLSVVKPTFKSGFRSFGTSLRVCPGRELAEMEVLVLLSYVLRKFEIRVKHNHPPLKYVTRIAQTPDSSVELVLQLRK